MLLHIARSHVCGHRCVCVCAHALRSGEESGFSDTDRMTEARTFSRRCVGRKEIEKRRLALAVIRAFILGTEYARRRLGALFIRCYCVLADHISSEICAQLAERICEAAAFLRGAGKGKKGGFCHGAYPNCSCDEISLEWCSEVDAAPPPFLFATFAMTVAGVRTH